MSNRDDQGGRSPPDDRTLLDPLSSDELEALRQARQRLAAQKLANKEGGGGDPPAGEGRRQVVLGPAADESMGHAPTRAMPALPSFDGKVSLDQIQSGRGASPEMRVSGQARDPASTVQADPESGPPESASVFTGTVPGADDEPTLAPQAHPEAPPGPRPRGKAGATGFGENTLMWMAPPRASPQAPATSDVLPRATPAEPLLVRLRKFGLGGMVVLVVLGLAGVAFMGGESGVIKLHTDPEGATVRIDGKLQAQRTPVKLTMNEGAHTIVLELDGYEPRTLELTADPEREQTEEVALVPRSEAGMVTLSVNVQPVAATIVVDGQTFEGKRSVKIANLDPSQAHTLEVSAPGYKKIEKKITPANLKASYTFVLQTDPTARP